MAAIIRPRVALLTSPIESLIPEERHTAQNDPVLMEALEEVGVEAFWLEWGKEDSLQKAWSCSLILIRSTWDYSASVERKDAFLAWLREAIDPPIATENSKPILLNPIELIEWNSDKKYLAELQSQGVAIVPSLFLTKSSSRCNFPDLVSLSQRWNCDAVILKPVVAGTARGISKHTVGPNPNNDAFEEAVNELLEQDDTVLVQPFMSSVHDGEYSIVCINGEVLYATLKTPTSGDFRVQGEWGGSMVSIDLTQKMIRTAKSILTALPQMPPYARLDFLLKTPSFDKDAEGQDEDEEDGNEYLLSEAEVIEPDLYFNKSPAGAKALAKLVASYCKN